VKANSDNLPASDPIHAQIPAGLAGMRLDQALAALLPGCSRSQLSRWISEGRVQLDERTPRARDRVRGGEQVRIETPPAAVEAAAQSVDLEVVYQDEALIVINKPAGLVVHPGAGNPDLTLMNGLLYLDAALERLPRAGIVHRLDKDTSGLLVVARTEPARLELIEQLKRREVSREYLAVVRGRMIAGGVIEAPLGRHRQDRLRMAVTARGLPARTDVRVLTRYRAHSLVGARLHSGRTHQVRVHLAHRGYPLVGDPVYGGRPAPPAGATAPLLEALAGFRRQALHAVRLGLVHPVSGSSMAWERPPPADMQRLIEALEYDARAEQLT